MKRLAERFSMLFRIPPQRPIESTRIELVEVQGERRQLTARRAHLAHLLADFRRQDGMLR